MKDILNEILTNVLNAMYQPFFFSVLFSVLCMFLLMYVKEHGWKESIRIWAGNFKTSSYFRRMLLLAFYTTMILFRTLLNRRLWINPLSDVMGGWRIYEDGELTTECIENVMLMVPFTALLLWAINSNAKMKKKLLKNMKLGVLLWQSTKITFLFSIAIEFLQLFLHLGTFQVSDIAYNTLGGFVGGLIYWLGARAWRVRDRSGG